MIGMQLSLQGHAQQLTDFTLEAGPQYWRREAESLALLVRKLQAQVSGGSEIPREKETKALQDWQPLGVGKAEDGLQGRSCPVLP